MSKFYNYINERIRDIAPEELEKFKEECYPALRDIKKNGYRFLYSGRRSIEMIIKKQVRKDRRPMDTPEEIHKLLDREFYDKFKIRPRSGSIFAILENDVSFYGDPYYLFPVGRKYMYIWSNHIGDLYGYINNKIKEKIDASPNTSLMMILKILDSDGVLYIDMNAPKDDRLPMWKKPKHDNYKEYTMDDIMNMAEDIVKGAVALYETSRSVRNIINAGRVEIMVYTDYVYLINSKKVNTGEMEQWIDANI